MAERDSGREREREGEREKGRERKKREREILINYSNELTNLFTFETTVTGNTSGFTPPTSFPSTRKETV